MDIAYDGTATPELVHHQGTCNREHIAYDGTATPELVHHQGTCNREHIAYNGPSSGTER